MPPNNINYELDFEKRIGEMKDRSLLEFVARQTLEIAGKCNTYDKQIYDLENGNRRSSGIIGGITGAITSIAISVINYLTTNRN